MPPNAAAAVTEDAGSPPVVDASRFDAANRRRLSGPGLRTFVTIANEWRLTELERMRALGLPGRSTYYNWLGKAQSGQSITLPLDTLLRISAMLGIYKALHIIFGHEAEGVEWLKSPNSGPLFGGQRPLDLVTSGTQDGLLLVRRYLDGWRGGLFSAPLPGFDDVAEPIPDEDIIWA